MRVLEGKAAGKGLRVAVVASRFNRPVVDRLVAGAGKALKGAGVLDRDVLLVWVPGAFEIPAAAARLAASGRVDAVVAVGCVLRGETAHFEQVVRTCADGVSRVSAESGVPVGFGVLACHTPEQALARSGAGGSNYGAHAALAALETADVLARLPKALK